jgi:2,4-dienoyl-CoA reductase-like NADH-dependent reductase (Old Yellow Enzyme family)
MERLFKIGEGGIGAIITGAAIVHPSGKSRPTSTYVGGDGCIPSLKVLTEGIKKTGPGQFCSFAIRGSGVPPTRKSLAERPSRLPFLGRIYIISRGGATTAVLRKPLKSRLWK